MNAISALANPHKSFFFFVESLYTIFFLLLLFFFLAKTTKERKKGIDKSSNILIASFDTCNVTLVIVHRTIDKMNEYPKPTWSWCAISCSMFLFRYCFCRVRHIDTQMAHKFTSRKQVVNKWRFEMNVSLKYARIKSQLWWCRSWAVSNTFKTNLRFML